MRGDDGFQDAYQLLMDYNLTFACAKVVPYLLSNAAQSVVTSIAAYIFRQKNIFAAYAKRTCFVFSSLLVAQYYID